MHWKELLHHQHSLPPGAPLAGVQWSPDIEPFDRFRPAYPKQFSDEEKQAQEEAGAKLKCDIEQTWQDGGKSFEIPPGLYRLREPIVLEKTEGFTLFARDVELVVIEQINHFRILENKDLRVIGPLTLDADPLPYTQGDIVGVNKEEEFIDVHIWDGYGLFTKGERVKFFNEEGIMLPHWQDDVQGIEDLGNRILRFKMSAKTWNHPTAEEADEIIKIGHFFCMEDGQCKGGLELRSNTNTTWEDVEQCCHALVWALPEYGDNTFIRWTGSRRRGTNRLAGGGYPLMHFCGGSYILLDSEIGHNFDDLTDIFTVHSFAHKQISSNQFLASDNFIMEGKDVDLYDLAKWELIRRYRVVKVEKVEDQESAKEEFKQIAEMEYVRFLDMDIITVTVDRDLDRELPGLVFVSLPHAICREMRFERNYIHDGLCAGINAKGAHSVIIKDNIIERSTILGIAVQIDPFWWEGNPSRNIEIVGNTVRTSAYLGKGPGITVYAGGSKLGTGLIQDGILIANNAVQCTAGPAISVSNSKNIEIRDNVLTDCGVYNKGYGSIFLDAVPDGTRVTGNFFEGRDSSIQNVQIKTGQRTPSSAIFVQGNRCLNPEVLVPDVAWNLIPMTVAGVEFHDGEWGDPTWPAHHKESFDKDALCIFSFEGSRVRILSFIAKWFGLSDVWIDDEFMGTIDLSKLNGEYIDTAYISPVLQEGTHTIKVRNRAEAGKFSTEDRYGLSIYGFDVLPSQCQPAYSF